MPVASGAFSGQLTKDMAFMTAEAVARNLSALHEEDRARLEARSSNIGISDEDAFRVVFELFEQIGA